jgi:hypothetical protein
MAEKGKAFPLSRRTQRMEQPGDEAIKAELQLAILNGVEAFTMEKHGVSHL